MECSGLSGRLAELCARRAYWLVLALVSAAAVGGLSLGARTMGERRALVLFDGPRTLCDSGDGGYYHRCGYVDSASGRVTPDVQAITGATAAFRMCSPSVYQELRPGRGLHITYPPKGAVFPPNLCAPFVEWADPVNDLWLVKVEIAGTDMEWRSIVRKRRWRVGQKAWRAVRRHGVGRDACITVFGVQRSSPKRSVHVARSVRVRVSRDPIDGCVVYRIVTPPFSTTSTPDTFVRHTESLATRPFILGRDEYCFNCHTFSSYGGTSGKLSLQSRYVGPVDCDLRTYLGVYDIGARRGRKLKLPFQIQMTTFTAWSPDGTKLALSANQQITTVPPIVHETQNATLPFSDIAVYDLEANRAYLLPGASASDRLALYPRWTPDGESVVFASAAKSGPQQRPLFDLEVVPFNGGRGGVSKKVPGASGNGRSHYYPRFSPDGKWLSFCQSNGGSLIKPSSDLWLMPGDLQGPARRLECNAELAADSWHSWSSNSRWLVFATKRDDGIYARLYLTHIDEEGRASPAVRLPVKEPPLASFNIPEFLREWPGVGERQLFEVFRAEAGTATVSGAPADGRARGAQ